MKQILNRDYSSQELVDGIESGDTDCACEFHRRYGKRISRLVWSLLGGDRDHDDVVQMVFVNVLASVGSIKDATRLNYWVDSVTFRTVRKELRSRRYRRQVVASSDTLSEVGDMRNPETDLIASRFYAVMNQLDPEDRMMFVMKYFENCTLLEMAEISGWSVATVKRRVTRAVEIFENLARTDSVLVSCMGEKNHVG